MGRRATVTTEITAGEPPEETAEEKEPGLSLFDASGDNRVRLLRRDQDTQKWTNHGYFPPTATEEDILKKFGGGQYWAQLLVQGQEGGESIKSSRKFTLIGRYYPPTGDLPGIRDSQPTQNGATVVGNIPTSGDDLMSVLKAGIINTLLEMMKSNKEMRAPGSDPMLLELMKQQAATQQAAMQQQQKMMEFMLTLATKDGGGDRKAALAEMLQYKELFAVPAGGTPSDPMGMFNSMLETFKSFRDAAEDVAPPRDTSDPVLGAIPKLAEVVMEQHQMQKAAHAQAAAAVVPHTVSVPTQRLPEMPMWRRILREQGARLLTSAAAKSDPDVIAGAAILFAPPAVRESLVGFFHREGSEVMADILTEIPLLADHREWLAEFVECAQVRLFPEEFEGEETETSQKSEDSTGEIEVGK